MNIKSIITTFLLLFLASCGPPQPLYRTDYQLLPPRSENGRMCANNCLMMQQNCRQSCTIQIQQCQQMNVLQQHTAELEADRRYEDYVRDRTNQGKLIKKTREDFYQNANSECGQIPCMNQCMSDYYTCHTNCGGQVIPHTMCVANCNLAPAPQAIPKY